MTSDVTTRFRRFASAVAILIFCFAVPLWKLFRFAAASDLYSYIFLVPFISIYLVWLKQSTLPVSTRPARPLAVIFLAAGTGLIAAYWLSFRSSLLAITDDYLAMMIICFLLFFYAISASFWGVQTLRATAFPLAFLLFLAPIPPAAVREVNSFLQSGSALAASAFFSLVGTSFLQNGLAFQLPGINLAIAPECSGIHSTVVLFMTALLSGYIFLRKPWNRAVLVLCVVPLGLLRNGFRVFVIGELCIHIGPQMIDSPIHRKGGPIFFVLSLIPLFIVLLVLLWAEKKRSRQIPDIQPCAN